MTSRAAIALLGCVAMFAAGCATAQKQPFDAHRCARSCIEMGEACKVSCMKTTDPMGVYSGSRESCERTCQSQRDTCDVQCMQGKDPSL